MPLTATTEQNRSVVSEATHAFDQLQRDQKDSERLIEWGGTQRDQKDSERLIEWAFDQLRSLMFCCAKKQDDPPKSYTAVTSAASDLCDSPLYTKNRILPRSLARSPTPRFLAFASKPSPNLRQTSPPLTSSLPAAAVRSRRDETYTPLTTRTVRLSLILP